jgi:hypothetical protein
MCVDTYTITDPWAVMIHAHHTFLAYRAVMSPWWFNTFALVAVTESDVVSNIINKFCIYLSLHFNNLLVFHSCQLIPPLDIIILVNLCSRLLMQFHVL